MKIDRLKTDLTKAKEKAAEWQARVRDLEKADHRAGKP